MIMHMKFGQYKFQSLLSLLLLLLLLFLLLSSSVSRTHNNMQYYYYAQTFFHDFEKGNKMVSLVQGLPYLFVNRVSISFIYGVTNVAWLMLRDRQI